MTRDLLGDLVGKSFNLVLPHELFLPRHFRQQMQSVLKRFLCSRLLRLPNKKMNLKTFRSFLKRGAPPIPADGLFANAVGG